MSAKATSRSRSGGIEDYLLQAGYLYFVTSHRHRDDLIEEYKRLLMDRDVEGVLALDTPFPRAAVDSGRSRSRAMSASRA